MSIRVRKREREREREREADRQTDRQTDRTLLATIMCSVRLINNTLDVAGCTEGTKPPLKKEKSKKRKNTN